MCAPLPFTWRADETWAARHGSQEWLMASVDRDWGGSRVSMLTIDASFARLSHGKALAALKDAKLSSKGGRRGPNLVAARLCVAVGALDFKNETKARKAFLHQAEIMASATVDMPGQ